MKTNRKVKYLLDVRNVGQVFCEFSHIKNGVAFFRILGPEPYTNQTYFRPAKAVPLSHRIA